MKQNIQNEKTQTARMCILCKEEKAKGITTNFYCKTCSKKDGLIRFATLQRHTKFDETISEYQKNCWEKEKVLITGKELLKRLRKKCNSFSPKHCGFKQMIEEVKQSHASTPKLIKAKIKLRKSKNEELIEVGNMIKVLELEIEKPKIKNDKYKYDKLVSDLKSTNKKKQDIEELLKKLQRKQ